MKNTIIADKQHVFKQQLEEYIILSLRFPRLEMTKLESAEYLPTHLNHLTFFMEWTYVPNKPNPLRQLDLFQLFTFSILLEVDCIAHTPHTQKTAIQLKTMLNLPDNFAVTTNTLTKLAFFSVPVYLNNLVQTIIATLN